MEDKRFSLLLGSLLANNAAPDQDGGSSDCRNTTLTAFA